MKKRCRELKEMFLKAGALEVENPVTTGRSHYCIRVTAPNGVQRKFFTGTTPGDRLANLNILATVRQFCRQNQAI